MRQPTDVIAVDQQATKTRRSSAGRTPDAVDLAFELDAVPVYKLSGGGLWLARHMNEIKVLLPGENCWKNRFKKKGELGIDGESATEGRADNL